MGKYNEGKSNPKENYQQSSIWKYLHEHIDVILASEIDEKMQKSSYISCPNIEEMLSSLLKYNAEYRYFMLTGVTGIGKTTIMRHVFFSDRVIMKPVIKNRNLIIPIDFDSYIESDDMENRRKVFEEFYARIFSRAAIFIQERFNIENITDKDFVEFMENTDSSLINYIDKNGKRNSLEQMRMEAYENNRLCSIIGELCFYLNHDNCNINNVIVIVDNIESLGVFKTDLQVPLLTAHKSLNIMRNKSSLRRGRRPKWVPNMLICCRHYIYRLMHTRDFEDDGTSYQMFESFGRPVYVDLDSPAQLNRIINRRYEAYIKMNRIKDKKRINVMFIVNEMLSKILEETSIDNRNLILDLNLLDIRSALKTFKDIIYNKPWIQRDDFEDNGSFSIDRLSDFNCKLTNILRSIGMKSGYVYNSEDNLIPNLLSNGPDNKVNIYDFLALKYFMNIDSTWRVPRNTNDFYNCINKVFNTKIDSLKDDFEMAIWHLLSNRMLLRCADQEQRDISSITINNYQQIKLVYISNAAKDYWKLIGENSTIFEMLVDDIYLDKKYIFKADRQANYRQFNKESFSIALSYLFEIFALEENIIKIAFDNRMENEYRKCFGSELITTHLLNGLSNSFDSYFRGGRSDESDYILTCRRRILDLQSKTIILHNRLK